MTIEEIPCIDGPTEIIHISHTKTTVEGEIKAGFYDIDFSKYELICHGGDIDESSSKSDAIFSDWNEIFNFDSERTLLSIGNHDTYDRDLIEQYTNRPSYFTYHFNNITFLVLDTHLSESNIYGEQLDLFNNICDTISSSSSLVILTHLLFWMPGNAELAPQIDSIANGKFGTCYYCTKTNNFYDDLYPRLVEVKNNGVQVLCIAGDLGKNVNEFEHKTEDDIFFLASGLDIPDPDAIPQVLLLQVNPQTNALDWQFETIDCL